MQIQGLQIIQKKENPVCCHFDTFLVDYFFVLLYILLYHKYKKSFKKRYSKASLTKYTVSILCTVINIHFQIVEESLDLLVTVEQLLTKVKRYEKCYHLGASLLGKVMSFTEKRKPTTQSYFSSVCPLRHVFYNYTSVDAIVLLFTDPIHYYQWIQVELYTSTLHNWLLFKTKDHFLLIYGKWKVKVVVA